MSTPPAAADRVAAQSSPRGQVLLEQPLRNKGTAFTEEERSRLGLLGLLPPHVETIDQQADRCYQAFLQQSSDLEQHVYLRNLQDANETLFYRVVIDHIDEALPIIYTPTVGEACQKFSHIYRRPRGLFIPFPLRDRIDEILGNCALPRVEVIVVTDAQRILGLGDQGAGGDGHSHRQALAVYGHWGHSSPMRRCPLCSTSAPTIRICSKILVTSAGVMNEFPGLNTTNSLRPSYRP